MAYTGPGPRDDGECCGKTVVTRCNGCPYVLAPKAIRQLNEILGNCEPFDAATIAPAFGTITEADHQRFVATLEAAGYTVTPPDPLAADREFLAGLMGALGRPGTAICIKDGEYNDTIPAAMEYLRQNKERL